MFDDFRDCDVVDFEVDSDLELVCVLVWGLAFVYEASLASLLKFWIKQPPSANPMTTSIQR